ncbi:MAG TPA: lipid-binding SYLF domain-containing protein [Acidobacteriota bacterium]|nr:lipid-binding SYLF domain-containing protein [Acidobacteriota bacterium]
MCTKRTKFFTLILTISITLMCLNSTLYAAKAAEIEKESNEALQKLYASNPEIKKLGSKAKGILVFPKITKAGFIVGGQGGDGALFKAGKAAGYYRSAAGSVGLQAGVQTYGYAMFFLDDESLKYLEESKGWEIGTGPSVVIADEGFGKTATTSTLKKGIVAFIFGQKGLMAGIGLQGSKITKINPD